MELWHHIKDKPHDISGISKPDSYWYENILGIYYPKKRIEVCSSFELYVEQEGDFFFIPDQGLTHYFNVYMPVTREVFTLQISPYDLEDEKTKAGDQIYIKGVFHGTDLIATEIHKL